MRIYGFAWITWNFWLGISDCDLIQYLISDRVFLIRELVFRDQVDNMVFMKSGRF